MRTYIDTDTSKATRAALLDVANDLAEALHDCSSHANAICEAENLAALAEDAALTWRALAMIMRRTRP